MVGLCQVLHNGDIIAEGYVRPLKPQAAEGAKDAEGTAEAGADAAPAEGAGDDAAAEKASPHLKDPMSDHACCLPASWHGHPGWWKAAANS